MSFVYVCRSPGPGCYARDDGVPPNLTKKRPVSAVHSPKAFYPHPPAVSRVSSGRHKNSNFKLTEKRQSSDLSTKLASSGKKVLNILGSAGQYDGQVHDWEHSQGPAHDNERSKSPSSSRYSPVKMFVCTGCDKMYTSQRDLDIHKSFCYGRISWLVFFHVLLVCCWLFTVSLHQGSICGIQVFRTRSGTRTLNDSALSLVIFMNTIGPSYPLYSTKLL